MAMRVGVSPGWPGGSALAEVANPATKAIAAPAVIAACADAFRLMGKSTE
jgi:hypothetical protein